MWIIKPITNTKCGLNLTEGANPSQGDKFMFEFSLKKVSTLVPRVRLPTVDDTCEHNFRNRPSICLKRMPGHQSNCWIERINNIYIYIQNLCSQINNKISKKIIYMLISIVLGTNLVINLGESSGY